MRQTAVLYNLWIFPLALAYVLGSGCSHDVPASAPIPQPTHSQGPSTQGAGRTATGTRPDAVPAPQPSAEPGWSEIASVNSADDYVYMGPAIMAFHAPAGSMIVWDSQSLTGAEGQNTSPDAWGVEPGTVGQNMTLILTANQKQVVVDGVFPDYLPNSGRMPLRVPSDYELQISTQRTTAFIVKVYAPVGNPHIEDLPVVSLNGTSVLETTRAQALGHAKKMEHGEYDTYCPKCTYASHEWHANMRCPTDDALMSIPPRTTQVYPDKGR